MAKGDDRKRLQVRVSEDALEGLYAIASRHHVTLTALLEAIGLAHRGVVFDPEGLAQAKRIDRERYNRR